eukprot:GHVU01184897.1.p1 GENE.GHVU01184897.1~~GHVU01184897.1.p1  ORF type:complete len:106 (-),score=5.62 GHVU01184897.1:273-590(-)
MASRGRDNKKRSLSLLGHLSICYLYVKQKQIQVHGAFQKIRVRLRSGGVTASNNSWNTTKCEIDCIYPTRCEHLAAAAFSPNEGMRMNREGTQRQELKSSANSNQ